MQYMQEMEISLEDLAEVFKQQNWQYANEVTYGIPTAEDLSLQIWNLMAYLMQDHPEYDFARSGRISLFRDPEFPESYEIYLQIGYLSPDEPTMEAIIGD